MPVKKTAVAKKPTVKSTPAKKSKPKKVNKHPEFNLQSSISKNGKKYGVGVGKDDDGFFVHTHRARSKSYASKDAIPVKDLKFIESTG